MYTEFFYICINVICQVEYQFQHRWIWHSVYLQLITAHIYFNSHMYNPKCWNLWYLLFCLTYTLINIYKTLHTSDIDSQCTLNVGSGSLYMCSDPSEIEYHIPHILRYPIRCFNPQMYCYNPRQSYMGQLLRQFEHNQAD
jgi:hypothetical protein